MPWLVRGEKGEEDFLFVHIPRCGGTSLTKLYRVPEKARSGRGLYHKCGMLYFSYRYWLLENANFPMLSIENALVVVQVIISIVLWYLNLFPSLDTYCNPARRLCAPGVGSVAMWSLAMLTFVCSTFIFTAPISGRLDAMRKVYMVLVGRVLCNFTAAYGMLTGVGDKGYIIHWTAAKMLRYGHVSEREFRELDNFTIVRNPYSRMVSIYMYNRFGCCESFETFVRRWHGKWKAYKASQSTEEWDVYCHVLPQYEYTHCHRRQLVRCVIRQEDLKGIVSGTLNRCLRSDSSETVVPPRIHAALVEMPHANKRERFQRWQDYYTPETVSLVLEMYGEDFATFGYSLAIPDRPDLAAALAGRHGLARDNFDSETTSLLAAAETEPPSSAKSQGSASVAGVDGGASPASASASDASDSDSDAAPVFHEPASDFASDFTSDFASDTAPEDFLSSPVARALPTPEDPAAIV